MKRRRWTKSERHGIYRKYRGHCAYCGRKIRQDEMQLDHIVALKNGGADSLANINPSCGLCNKYKKSLSLEEFRSFLSKDLPERLGGYYLYILAADYGIVRPQMKKWNGKFYFERKRARVRKSCRTVIVTENFLYAGNKRNSGFTGAELRLLGVDLPLRKGWKDSIVGKPIPAENARKYLALRKKSGR